MTKDEIANQILSSIVNLTKCTIVADMGVGKSKIALEWIQSKNVTNVIIICKSNLINNWKSEINKFGYKNLNFIFTTIYNFNNFLNIEEIENVGIIIDEIHEILTPLKTNKLLLLKNTTIPIIGLTGTPDDKKKSKKDYYNIIAPIAIRYQEAQNDKIINKIKIRAIKYDLTNDYKIQVQKYKKSWLMGEKDAYDLLEDTVQKTSITIKETYLKEVRERIKNVLETKVFNSGNNFGYVVKSEYIKVLSKLYKKDLDTFKRYKKFVLSSFEKLWENKKSTNPNKELLVQLNKNLGFYWIIKYIIAKDYSILGINHRNYISYVPEYLRKISYDYLWAIQERVRILNNLTSSVIEANRLKRNLLKKGNNRVLLYSKTSDNADKLSVYTVHSNNSKERNFVNLSKFKSGEINEIASCKMLSTGQNFKGVNYAIFESFDSSKVTNLQQIGRLARLDPNNEEAEAIFIIPKNTQTEKWYDSLFN